MFSTLYRSGRNIIKFSNRSIGAEARGCLYPGRTTGSVIPSYQIGSRLFSNDSSTISMWKDAAKDMNWINFPSITLDQGRSPFNRWFPDGVMNTCFNAVDRHVEIGNGSQTALIYDSPVTNTIRKISYSDLLTDVSYFAGLLAKLGVKRGDTVIIYMPMIPEAIVAMLACSRLGAIHSVVFGGFASPELAVRIKDIAAKVVLTTSCGIDGSRIVDYKGLVDKAIDLSSPHEVETCLVLQRPQLIASLDKDRDVDWAMAVSDPTLAPVSHCEPMASTDPLYVLYTSGTTAAPKGIVRDHGGHAVALKWAMYNVFGMRPKDVFWAASDIGWVVGHSFSVYAPLLQGCTTIIYEGKPVGTPDAGAFWRVIEQHKVNALFTAPTALRAVKLQDPEGAMPANYDLSSLRHLFLAGERADPGTINWAENSLKVPVIDNWWQTETGWPICGLS